MADKGLNIKLKMPASSPFISEDDNSNLYVPSPEIKNEVKSSQEKKPSKPTSNRGRKRRMDRLPSSPLFKPGRSSLDSKFARQKFGLSADKFYKSSIKTEASDSTMMVPKSERYLTPPYGRGNNNNFSTSSPQHDPYSQFTHVLRLTSGQEEEPDIVMLDHCYAMPWHRQVQSTFAWPRKLLFVSKLSANSKLSCTSNLSDEDIVVDGAPPALPQLPYDVDKARQVMEECERHVIFAKLDRVHKSVDLKSEEEQEHNNETDWTESVQRAGWTDAQNDIFDKAVSILDADRLARLALKDTHDEPVKRRVFIDKTAAKYRKMLGKVRWDMKLCQWLHGQLIQNLSTSYLAAYLDVLQTMKSKIPSLVDKMISLGSSHRAPSTEALNLLLKRPWDPAVPVLSQHKPRKLDRSPIIIQVPSNASSVKLPQTSRRIRFFNTQLQHLAKSLPVSVLPDCTDATGILDHLLVEVRNKVVECKTQYPGHPIVLLGWGVGAVIATNVSMVESVSANICLGYPVSGCTGKRGEVDDPLLDSKTPTLFIIGERASNASIDDMEDIRHNMGVETGLVVIAGGDSLLRVSWEKRYWEGLTQSMVDRCIVDEIGEFLTQLWTKPQNSSIGSFINNNNNNSLQFTAVSSSSTRSQSPQATTSVPFTNPLPPKPQKKEGGRKRKLSPDSSPSSPKVSLANSSASLQGNAIIANSLNLKIPVGVSALSSSLLEGGDSTYQYSNIKGTADSVTASSVVSPPKKRGRKPGDAKKVAKISPLSKPSTSTDASARSVSTDSALSTAVKEESTSPISATSVNSIPLGSLASVSRQKYQRMIQLSSTSSMLGNDKGAIGRNLNTADEVITKVHTPTTTSLTNQITLVTGKTNISSITGWNIKRGVVNKSVSGFHPITPIESTSISSNSVIIGTPTIESADDNTGEPKAIPGVSLDDLSELEGQTVDIRDEPIIEVYGAFGDDEKTQDIGQGTPITNLKVNAAVNIDASTVVLNPQTSLMNTITSSLPPVINKVISSSSCDATSSNILTPTTVASNLSLGSTKGRVILTSNPRVIKPLGNVKPPGVRNIISTKSIKPETTQQNKLLPQTLMLVSSSSATSPIIKTIVTSAASNISSVRDSSSTSPIIITATSTSVLQTTTTSVNDSEVYHLTGQNNPINKLTTITSPRASKQNKQGIITKTFTLSSASVGKTSSNLFSFAEAKKDNTQIIDVSESLNIPPSNNNINNILKLSTSKSEEQSNTLAVGSFKSSYKAVKPVQTSSNVNIIKASISDVNIVSSSSTSTNMSKCSETSLSSSLTSPISCTVDPTSTSSLSSSEVMSFSIKVDPPNQSTSSRSSIVVIPSTSSTTAKTYASKSLNTSTITVLSSTKQLTGNIFTLSSSSKSTGQLTNTPSNMITSMSRPTIGTNFSMKPTVGSIVAVPSSKMSVPSSLNPIKKFVTGSITSTASDSVTHLKKSITSTNKVYPLRIVSSSKNSSSKTETLKLSGTSVVNKSHNIGDNNTVSISQVKIVEDKKILEDLKKGIKKKQSLSSDSLMPRSKDLTKEEKNTISDKTTSEVTLEFSPIKNNSTENSEVNPNEEGKMKSLEVNVECNVTTEEKLEEPSSVVVTRSRKSSEGETSSKIKLNKNTCRKARISLSNDKKSLRSNTFLTPDNVRETRLSSKGKGKNLRSSL